MPIYEYACSKCSKEFELIHGVNNKPKATCPECGGKGKKIISLGAFHLKGGGWYKDGYSSGGNGKKNDSSTPAPKSDSKEKSSSKETVST